MTGYRRSWLTRDLTAGLIATVMLIPQSLAYALLSVSKQGLSRVLLTMSAINRIATTALDALTNLDRVFKERDVCI